MPQVRDSSRFAAFLTSFMVQAGYHYEGFQNIGFAAMLLPALKDLYPDEEELVEGVRRHLGFFNAHPYLTSYAAGALIRMEEERARGVEEAHSDQALGRFKQVIGSILGNLGDRFFWAGLLPLTALAGLCAFLVDPLWGALALLVLYNLPHLITRAEGLRMGYQMGAASAPAAAGEFGRRQIRWVRRLAAAAGGALIPLAAAHPLTPPVPTALGVMAGAALAMALLLRLRMRRVLTLLAITGLISLYTLLT
ncbi:MAG: PTS system mannose/fructose/sorbose family transporter subunit IID [bacterium]